MRPLALRQARDQFSAWHPKEVFLTELTGDEEIELNLGDRRRENVLNECND
jgi:hypothetical protein